MLTLKSTIVFSMIQRTVYPHMYLYTMTKNLLATMTMYTRLNDIHKNQPIMKILLDVRTKKELMALKQDSWHLMLLISSHPVLTRLPHSLILFIHYEHSETKFLTTLMIITVLYLRISVHLFMLPLTTILVPLTIRVLLDPLRHRIRLNQFINCLNLDL